MNHNTSPFLPPEVKPANDFNPDANPFASPASPVDNARFIAETIKESKRSTRVRRAIGDKMLNLVGKSNKVARVDGYSSSQAIREGAGGSIDTVLSDYGKASKAEINKALTLRGNLQAQDIHGAEKQRIQDQIAEIEAQKAKVYMGEHSQLAEGVSADSIIKHMDGLKRQEEAKLAKLSEHDGAYEDNVRWAAGVVGSQQRNNMNYNAAAPQPPEVDPRDLPGYNPFAPENMTGTPPVPESSQSPFVPPRENPFR